MKNIELSDNLKPRQKDFILALVSEPNVTKAIAVAKVSRTQGYKWLKDPVFNAEYMKFKRELIKATTTKIQATANLAIDTLINIMQNDLASDTAKVQSAKTILEYSYKGFELEDLLVRVEELENKIIKGD